MVSAARELAAKLKGKPFVHLWIASDGNREVFKARCAKAGIHWPTIFLPCGTLSPEPHRWRVSIWPTIYIVDDTGTIRFVETDDQGLRGREMDAAVSALIAEMEGGPLARPDVRKATLLLRLGRTPYEVYDGYAWMKDLQAKYKGDEAIERLAKEGIEKCEKEKAGELEKAKAVYAKTNEAAELALWAIEDGGGTTDKKEYTALLGELNRLVAEAGPRSRLAQKLIRQIRSLERSARGPAFLGVQPDAAFSGEGVKIGRVIRNTAAAKAGLKAGDILLRINDTSLRGPRDLTSILKGYKPWDEITVQIRRKDKEGPVTLQIVLGRRTE
ncbi:MAG: PDZ domain-containing protein [Planctomycetota bacterium]|jgi:hypothetical protein